MKKKLVLILAISSLLIACASDPIVTDRDILAAENSHTLNALYERLQADKKLAKSSSEWAQSIRLNLDKVGKKIALKQEQNILSSLQSDVVTYDNVALLKKQDIATLDLALNRCSEIEPYNKEIYFGLRLQIEKAISNKKAEVQIREAEFKRLSDRDAVQKVTLLDEIMVIYGGDKSEEVKLQKNAYIEGLFNQAEQSLERKRHEDVVMLLDNLEEIDPDYPGLLELRHRLHADEYEQQFWDALAAGDTDKAYELFYKLSLIPGYLDNNHALKPIAEDIAQYFIESGNSAMITFKLPEAYEAFSRVRYLRSVLGKQDKYSEEENAFIAFIEKRVKHFMMNKAHIHAYGFLSILEEMKPGHEMLAELGPQLNNEVLGQAIIKVLPLQFSDSSNTLKIAATVHSDFIHQVQEVLPTRVEILDAQQRKDYTADKVASMDNAAGYFVLSGEILMLTMNTDSVETVETKSVETSTQRVENPEYITWLNLSKRAKKQATEPEQTIDKSVSQDVNIKHINMTKKAETSLTYRINEIVSTDVFVSDVLTEQQVFEAEAIEALEVGLFTQAEQVAELADDNKMLGDLSLKIAERAAEKLSANLDKMEDNYTEKANLAYVAKDYSRATHNFAYRNVLFSAQGKKDKDILKGLRTSAINWQ